jgi:hypothetical protein
MQRNRRIKQEHDLKVQAQLNAQIDRIFSTLTQKQKNVLAKVVLLGNKDTAENNVLIYKRDESFLQLSRLIMEAIDMTSLRDGMSFTRSFIQQDHQHHFDLVRIDPYLLQLIEAYIHDNNISIRYEQ